MADTNFRTIESVGRYNLIKELTDRKGVSSDAILKGVGDDAAVIDESDTTAGLLTTESFLEGVNFDLVYTPLRHLGYKVVTAAVSDIYAMNGSPEAILINLALPNKLSADMVNQIYDGVYAASKDYGAEVAGGDINASHRILVMGVTVYGRCPKENIVYRSGAKVGDAICATGDLGGAIAGLRILMREKKEWEEGGQEQFQPDLSEYQYVIQRQLYPMARYDIIKAFNEEEVIPSSMIDISQGLVSEIHLLTESSGVGAYMYQSAIPIDLDTRKVADEMKEDVDKYALYGGEDFELLFTLPEKLVEQISEKIENFTVIGRITEQEEGVKMQTPEGDVISFEKE